MLTARALLGRGYFPQEIPPPFTSAELAAKVGPRIGRLPAAFGSGRAKLLSHDYVRGRSLRRRFGVPNPVCYVALSRAIAQGWSVLERFAQNSKFAASRPTVGSIGGRAIVPLEAQRMLPLRRAQSRTGARYLLITDVARFYHSIYTHSIPWALHGKSVAKRNRGPSLIGNILDQQVRNSQDGQTIGLPVGPDSSLLIAELLLSAVDRKVSARLPNLKGIRYIDDYELCFPSLSAAEAAVTELQNALTEFELALNPAKTRIVELPQPLDFTWAAELSSHRLRPSRGAQATDLIDFFSKAFELAQERSRDSVLNFAIGRLRSITVDRANWTLLENLLLQCCTSELGTLRFVIYELRRYETNGFPINRQTLGDVINEHLERAATLGHASEAAWALWCTIAFQIPIDRRPARAISKMSDSVVALVALDARDRGLIGRGLDTSTWQSFMTTDALTGEQWLLSYEANVKGWLPSSSGRDHVAQDAGFAYLKRLGVSFYDPRKLTVGAPASAGPQASGPYGGLP